MVLPLRSQVGRLIHISMRKYLDRQPLQWISGLGGFELEDSADQDVLMEKNKVLIRELLESGCILGLGIAIFCSSFSRAVRPPVRSSAEPYGLANLSGKMLEKVLLGNAYAIWASSLIQLCRELKIHYWVENPDGSFLWLLPEFLQLGSNQSEQLCRLDYCNFGTVWRKRTRFLTSCHLAGQVWWCSRDHRHVHLKGWNKQKHCAWTRFAQTYPRALCKILATALLIDCDLLPNRRHVLLSSVSRCQHCRIGEAKNPGPRRVLAQQRDVEQLRNFTLVNKGTASLGNQVWKSFQRWLASEFLSAAVSSLQRSGEVLGLLVVEFGRYLYASGQSIYLMRQLVTHIQRVDPPKCPYLYEAWRLISKWESLEPTVHRTPMPFVIYRAMVSSALAFGWRRVAGVIVLTFEAICRPGEVLKATRSDLLLPCDLIAEDPGRIFLIISNPKSKRRGLGTTQHAKVQNMAVANFLQEIFGHLDPQLPLYPASATTFRKRWNLLLETLHIPITVGLTPASLRAGGAVKAYRSDDDITKLLWKMRLKNPTWILQRLVGASVSHSQSECNSSDFMGNSWCFRCIAQWQDHGSPSQIWLAVGVSGSGSLRSRSMDIGCRSFAGDESSFFKLQPSCPSRVWRKSS